MGECVGEGVCVFGGVLKCSSLIQTGVFGLRGECSVYRK